MRTRVASSAVAALAAALGLAVVVLPALPASAKGLTQSQINAIEKNLNHGKKLTFSATYTAVNGGQKTTVTIAQAPPKSDFSSGTSSVINNGKTTYICTAGSSSGGTGSTGSTGSSGAGKESCITESGANPLLSLEDIFSPAVALAALNEAKSAAIARSLGIHLTESSGNYAGQSATCFSVSERGKGSGKYCVTKQGILAYATTSNNGSTNYFELTKYSSSPPSSLFSPPAGATTVTTPSLPAGVTIPT
ncbi:MAG TPA: hypothetical protein VIY26_01295 [Acidimicrobiales bacterium]